MVHIIVKILDTMFHTITHTVQHAMPHTLPHTMLHTMNEYENVVYEPHTVMLLNVNTGMYKNAQECRGMHSDVDAMSW